MIACTFFSIYNNFYLTELFVVPACRLCPERISFHSNLLFLSAGVVLLNSCPAICVISYINAPFFPLDYCLITVNDLYWHCLPSNCCWSIVFVTFELPQPIYCLKNSFFSPKFVIKRDKLTEPGPRKTVSFVYGVCGVPLFYPLIVGACRPGLLLFHFDCFYIFLSL